MPSLKLKDRITVDSRDNLPSFKGNLIESLKNLGNLYNKKDCFLEDVQGRKTWKAHLDFKLIFISLVIVRAVVSKAQPVGWLPDFVGFKKFIHLYLFGG